MKLGILVVYLVSEDNERLIDIHLDQIKKNTTTDFVLYACTNMLLPQFVDKLKQFKYVKLNKFSKYNGPIEDRRGAKEHSYYLDQLIKVAIKDNVTHFAIFHPDSFPVKPGWENELSKKLTESLVLISIFPQMSGCAFFSRNFYLNNKPSLLPKSQEELSLQWAKFQKTNEPSNLIETGMGYAFKAYTEGLIWYKLKRSNREEYHHHFGGIYDDLIFHLGSASGYKSRPMKGYLKNTIFNRAKQFLIKIMPDSIKSKIRNTLPAKVISPEIEKNRRDFLKLRDMLFNDTENFLHNLMSNNKNHKSRG